jgi:hypothetical protein
MIHPFILSALAQTRVRERQGAAVALRDPRGWRRGPTLRRSPSLIARLPQWGSQR